MYAVFQIGKKQYRVFNKQIIYVDRINVNIGKILEFNQVLFLKDNNDFYLGNPFIEKFKVIATVLDHNLDQKIKIVKFRRRKHFRRIQGHRQRLTKIEITSFVLR